MLLGLTSDLPVFRKVYHAHVQTVDERPRMCVTDLNLLRTTDQQPKPSGACLNIRHVSPSGSISVIGVAGEARILKISVRCRSVEIPLARIISVKHIIFAMRPRTPQTPHLLYLGHIHNIIDPV